MLERLHYYAPLCSHKKTNGFFTSTVNLPLTLVILKHERRLNVVLHRSGLVSMKRVFQ